MMHFSCDFCGKDLIPGGSTRYVVKMEAFPAPDPVELTEEDTNEDHVEEMARLLDEQEETGDVPAGGPASRKMRFDLCQFCHRRFVADPLGREAASKLHFSEN